MSIPSLFSTPHNRAQIHFVQSLEHNLRELPTFCSSSTANVLHYLQALASDNHELLSERTQRAPFQGMTQNHDLTPLPSVLSALRAGTHTRHVALEKRLPFFSPTLDRALYKRLLAAYYGFYQALELALVNSPAIPPDFDLRARLKTPAMLRDLHALGISPTSVALCQNLPALDSQASVLGVLYVLEGATLGGQILRKHVSQHLNIDAHNGGAFLYVYAQATGRRWKNFLEFLDNQSLDTHAQAQTVQAACLTFSCFERWFESQEVLL